MDIVNLNLSTDAACILRYMENFPDEYLNVRELARRADSRQRYVENPNWVVPAVRELLNSELLEADGASRFRLRKDRRVAAQKPGGKGKFISPQLRSILERSDKPVDLSDFNG